MQWKEFLLGNRANKLVVWTKHRNRSVELLVTLEHRLYGEIALLKTNILMRISSLTFFYKVIFPLKTECLE